MRWSSRPRESSARFASRRPTPRTRGARCPCESHRHRRGRRTVGFAEVSDPGPSRDRARGANPVVDAPRRCAGSSAGDRPGAPWAMTRCPRRDHPCRGHRSPWTHPNAPGSRQWPARRRATLRGRRDPRRPRAATGYAQHRQHDRGATGPLEHRGADVRRRLVEVGHLAREQVDVAGTVEVQRRRQTLRLQVLADLVAERQAHSAPKS